MKIKKEILTNSQLKKLKSIGYDLNKSTYIGSGSHGSTYKLPSNNILKITDDATEAVSSTNLIGEKLKYVANIYRVFKLKSLDDIYFIEQEFLDKLIGIQNKDLDKLFKDSDYYFYLTNSDTIRENLNDAEEKIKFIETTYGLNDISSLRKLKKMDNERYYYPLCLGYDIDLKKTDDIDFLNNILQEEFISKPYIFKLFCDVCDGLIELKDNNIIFTDIHKNNILQRESDGNYCIIDLGLSEANDIEIEVVENNNVKY